MCVVSKGGIIWPVDERESSKCLMAFERKIIFW